MRWEQRSEQPLEAGEWVGTRQAERVSGIHNLKYSQVTRRDGRCARIPLAIVEFSQDVDHPIEAVYHDDLQLNSRCCVLDIRNNHHCTRGV